MLYLTVGLFGFHCLARWLS